MTSLDAFYSDYPFLFNPADRRWGEYLEIFKRFDSCDFSREKLRSFCKADPQDVARCIDAICMLVAAVNELRSRGLKRLPPDTMGTVASAADACCNCVENLKQTITKEEAGQQQAIVYGCIKDVSDLYRKLTSAFAISTNGMQAHELTQLLDTAKKTQTSILELSSQSKAQIEGIKSESQAVIEELKKDLHDRLASDEAKRFEALAVTYGNAAWRWLAASIALAVVIVVAAVAFYVHASYLPDAITTGKAIQLSVAKLVVVSVASFMLFTCVRNYRANRHNQVLSTNRATTMEVYRAFLLSVEGSEAKDKLLCLVAEMAFNLRQTGYDFSGRDDSHPMQQIFDFHNLTKPPSP